MEDIKLWHATNIEEYLQADIDKPRKEIYWEENIYLEMKLNWEVIKRGDTWQHIYTIMSKKINKLSYDHSCILVKHFDTW
jgi:hypothetical protein